MCDAGDQCCSQLEAEALSTNEQLLEFDVRSRNVKWHEYVTPLQARGGAFYLQRQFNLIAPYREPIGHHNRREVLVCHDMMGNYLEDRHYHASKKYDDYRFYHWSGIDYFCYFSHNYITIPPCGWINAAHKHGVKVLGTFITEGSSGSRLLHEILHSTEMMDNIVGALVKLCKHYNFEGWLVNVECRVNPHAVENLQYFVQHLRAAIEEQVEHGIVIWYDSVIESGELVWQNEINATNACFFNAASAMLVNYGWNENSLRVTRELCDRDGHAPQSVFFGIDVFGRGQLAKFQTRRTLAAIVQQRFSAGIFAPGWTFETLHQYGYDIKQPLGDQRVNEAFLQRNEKYWWLLWEYLGTHPYVRLPFYTDFCLGSGRQNYASGLPMTPDVVDAGSATTAAAAAATSVGGLNGLPASVGFFNLSRQSLQPSVPLHGCAERYYSDAFNGGSCLRIVQTEIGFRLFATDFQMPGGGVVCAYAYKLQQPRDGELDLILRFCTGNNARDCHLFLGDYGEAVSQQKGRCYVSPFKPKYNEMLSGSMESTLIPKDMAFAELAANGWRTRYYVVMFNGAVQVKDIGVLYRRPADAVDHAYLGAVYVNTFGVMSDINFPADSNAAYIRVYGEDLLN